MRDLLIEMGDKIKQRRELLGLIQPDLANMAEISTRTIQLIEQGKGNPSLETLFRLLDPLGLELDLNIKTPQKSQLNS
jgi:transcriptional regulator with XRE-family HTH domain